MSYEIESSGIFGGQEAAPEPTETEQLNEAESDAGALDVDPELANKQPTSEEPTTEEGQQQQRKQVPLTALQEERQRRQEAAQELQRERENNRILQDRFNQFLLAQQQMQQQAQNPPQQPKEIPSFAEDPEGHVQALKEQFEQRIAQLAQQNQQHGQYNQEAMLRQQLMQEAVASETAYRAKVPDYDSAAKFLTERKTAEYMALGLDAGAAAARVSQDYYGLTAMAKQQGRDPADVVYGWAKAAGYTASSQPAPQQLKAQNPAPTSLSNLPGAHTAEDDGKLTAAKINQMSDAEFKKLTDDMRRAAGGNQRPRT